MSLNPPLTKWPSRDDEATSFDDEVLRFIDEPENDRRKRMAAFDTPQPKSWLEPLAALFRYQSIDDDEYDSSPYGEKRHQ